MSTASRVLPARASSPNEDEDEDESAPTAERREDATSANRTTRLLHFKVDLPPCFHMTVGIKTVFLYGKPV